MSETYAIALIGVMCATFLAGMIVTLAIVFYQGVKDEKTKI